MGHIELVQIEAALGMGRSRSMRRKRRARTGEDRREVWADLVYAPDEVTRALAALAERYRAEAEQDQQRSPYAGGGR